MKDKIPNLQKESDRLKIKKTINEKEDIKAKLLLEMGVITYSKIRKEELIDSDFENISEEIKNIDIEIYNQYSKLNEINDDNRRVTCVCGYVAYKNEKFCPQCGSNLMPEEKAYVLCKNCNTKNQEDSNYCGCCGHKIDFEKEEVELPENYDFTNENTYITAKEEEIFHIDNIEECYEETEYKEVNCEEEVIEIEGREFLKHQQIQDVEDDEIK